MKKLLTLLIIVTAAMFTTNIAIAEERTLQSITVKFDTLDDDKDKEESIDLKVQYINTIDASINVGGNEKFNDHSTQTYELEVKPPLDLAKARRAFLKLYKHPYGSETGNGWNVKIEVVGHWSA